MVAEEPGDAAAEASALPVARRQLHGPVGHRRIAGPLHRALHAAGKQRHHEAEAAVDAFQRRIFGLNGPGLDLRGQVQRDGAGKGLLLLQLDRLLERVIALACDPEHVRARRNVVGDRAFADELAVEIDEALAVTRADLEGRDAARCDELDVPGLAALDDDALHGGGGSGSSAADLVGTRRDLAGPRSVAHVDVVDEHAQWPAALLADRELALAALRFELHLHGRRRAGGDIRRLIERLQAILGDADAMRSRREPERRSEGRRTHPLVVDGDGRAALGGLDGEEPGAAGELLEARLGGLLLRRRRLRAVGLQPVVVGGVRLGLVLLLVVRVREALEGVRARGSAVRGIELGLRLGPVLRRSGLVAAGEARLGVRRLQGGLGGGLRERHRGHQCRLQGEHRRDHDARAEEPARSKRTPVKKESHHARAYRKGAVGRRSETSYGAA